MSDLEVLFDCGGCGTCCLHLGAPPFHSFEKEHVPAWALEEIENERRRLGGNNDGPCLWFDAEARNCKHHDIRPTACRNFEIGEEACRLLRTHYQIS